MLLVDQGWFDTRPDVVGLIGDPLIPVSTTETVATGGGAAGGELLVAIQMQYSSNTTKEVSLTSTKGRKIPDETQRQVIQVPSINKIRSTERRSD